MVIPLLQSLYDPRGPISLSDAQYEDILKDIEIFSLSSQVYHLIGDRDIGRMPEFFVKRLNDKYVKGMHQNLFMRHKEQEKINRLESKGLSVIPLKGVHFAERYFGHFAARVSGDIDLLVPVSELQQAIACVEGLGYTFEIIKDHHARLHDKNGLMVELHWTLDKQHWSDLHVEPFWQKAEPLKDYRYVKQLSDLHTFYFICLHGARHQMDSMRYVLDIVQMIHSAARSSITRN
ncbi:nucleotidyltransferase family protein [Paenibacillus sp. P25]|nr:nucleotidyltransferase family protein [Paenibacillus sp. P25]